MPNLFDRMFGIKSQDIPFAPFRPSYIPPIKGMEPLVEGDEQWLYQGKNIVFYGGLAAKDGSFVAIRESTAPIEQKIDNKFSEATNFRVVNTEIIIHRKPFKNNEYKQPSEDKRQIFASWQYKDIYFLLISGDVSFSETTKVIASMIT